MSPTRPAPPRRHPAGICALIAALLLAAPLAAAESMAETAAAAQAAHGRRDLGTASALYTKLLAAEPPVPVNEEQRALILRHAPRLHLVPREFFPLKDIVAILHPERPLIAYHLFWDDDLGFPSDNDPCDHEVIWIEYDRSSQRVTRVTTYWHGRLVSTDEAVVDANAHAGRAWIGVEWGFHGSLPWRAVGSVPIVDEILRSHWTKAHETMKNQPRDPLARGWPTEFAGDFKAYTQFSVALDPRPLLRDRGLLYVSRWANATINRYCLRYNFAAKTEWPPAPAP